MSIKRTILGLAVVALIAAACTTSEPAPTTTTTAPAVTAAPAGGLDDPTAEPTFVQATYPTDSLDPVLSHTMQSEVRIPNTTAAADGEPVLHASELQTTRLIGTDSLLGHAIADLKDPMQDLELALGRLALDARDAGNAPLADLAAARQAEAILTGTTAGEVYDGFALLNYNRGAFADDHVDGEYKMKRLVDSGERFVSPIDGEIHTLWELTINMLWYGQNFDSDTFLIRIPFESDPYDQFRINWRIYSLIQEDLSPTTITNDGFGRIFHGLDSTFATLPANHLSEITISYPSLKHFRGMYVWGWGVHPPRVQFLQPVIEISEAGDLDPFGTSFATRTREDLTLDAISDVAPEMKAYEVALAALSGATGDEITAMLTDPDAAPSGTFRQWMQAANDLRSLPPEAWAVLEAEDGLAEGEFGDYDVVVAYLNNEMYGDSPYSQFATEGKGGVIKDWIQTDEMHVKVINLDNHVHYYRNVDFSSQLTHGIDEAFGNGKFSFEKMSPKPSYGAPKVAEMQWRTGWGYVPHAGIQQQEGVFPRAQDRAHLKPFLDQFGEVFYGYVFENASGYWRFSPPDGIRESDIIPAGDPLREADGSEGVMIGYDTEGFGVAKMPESTITTHPNQDDFAELNFPGFLRNPTDGGDIIPPTPIWSPFLALNPETGTLRSPDGSYWVNETYLHGAPVLPGETLEANIEAPRAGGQLFYQFDPLFHDNMIYSLHPRSDIVR